MNADRQRVRIKICGITTHEDAEAAIEAGADALGFNTWPGTKRFIDLNRESEWLARLPTFVTKVALLVNASIEDAERIAGLSFIDVLQLHGDENLEYCEAIARFARPFIKVLRLRSRDDFSQLSDMPTPHFLIDAHVAGQFGGTGIRVDHALAAEFKQRFPGSPLILAGGLKPDNVGAAVRRVRPYAVDVSSGVEIEAGRKDRRLMRDFVRAVRDAEGD